MNGGRKPGLSDTVIQKQGLSLLDKNLHNTFLINLEFEEAIGIGHVMFMNQALNKVPFKVAMAQKGFTEVLLYQGARVGPGALLHLVGARAHQCGPIYLLKMDISQKHHVVPVKPFKRIAIGTIIEKSILKSSLCNGAMKEGY